MQEPKHLPLAEAPRGKQFLIIRVKNSDPELLRYLEELGLVPQAVITVLNREPFGGPFWLKINDRTYALGQEAASHIFVQPMTSSEVSFHALSKKSRKSGRRPA